MDITSLKAFLEKEVRRLGELVQHVGDLDTLDGLAQQEESLAQRTAECETKCTDTDRICQQKISTALSQTESIVEKAKKDAGREITRTETECKKIQDELVVEKATLGAALKKMRSEYNTVHKKLGADTQELASLEQKLEKARKAIASVK